MLIIEFVSIIIKLSLTRCPAVPLAINLYSIIFYLIGSKGAYESPDGNTRDVISAFWGWNGK